MLIHSWCNEPASCVVTLVHCASCVVKVRALLGRSAPDPQKLVPMPTPRSWNPRRHSKPSGTSGFWWERPCLRSMCLRVCVVVDVTKPLLQLISVYFVRCKELPFCSFSCSLLGAWPYFHGLIYTDGTGPGWQWQAFVEWWPCLATCGRNQQPSESTPAGTGAARTVSLGNQAFLGRAVGRESLHLWSLKIIQPIKTTILHQLMAMRVFLSLHLMWLVLVESTLRDEGVPQQPRTKSLGIQKLPRIPWESRVGYNNFYIQYLINYSYMGIYRGGDSPAPSEITLWPSLTTIF